MTFLQRLKFYGIGFFLGILVVYAIFGNRSCTSPGEIKMHELASQHYIISEKAQCKLNCLHKNEALIRLELRHFEVNYDASTPQKKPCGEYFVSPKEEFKGQYPYQIMILDCDTFTRIDDIQITSAISCSCQ
jgi:hypothetical protein